MSITITPFTKQQLLPQEEKLEVARQKSELSLVFQKKLVTKNAVFASPDAVNSLTYHGHRVMIEAELV
jgi:alanine dehydrogenase